MATLTCTPSNLIATKACLNCLSQKQLKAIMVYVLKISTGLTLPQLLANSACYKCLSDHELLVALTAMIVNQLAPTMSVNDLVNSNACKVCGSEKALNAELVYLFCNYYQQTAV